MTSPSNHKIDRRLSKTDAEWERIWQEKFAYNEYDESRYTTKSSLSQPKRWATPNPLISEVATMERSLQYKMARRSSYETHAAKPTLPQHLFLRKR